AYKASLRIEEYLRLLPQIIMHFDQLLEFATDPAMNLAEEIRQLRRERDLVLIDLQRLLASRDSQNVELQQLRSALQQLRSEIANLDLLRKGKEMTLAGMRQLLKTSERARSNAVASTAGELAKLKELHKKQIDEIEKRHRTELEHAKARSEIAINELRKKAEKA